MTSARTDSESPTPSIEQAPPVRSNKVRFAIKTALSLTLAYLIPMALGWGQPQTAAITVMLIAATGSLSESLQKGVMRTAGTIAGAVIGLSLIALFPQDRMLYLLALSTYVAVALYFYSSYQGDSTVFMLSIVVALMVFNGGDAEGAFIYGVDRTLLTVFGVLTYSVVGSFLWPVALADKTNQLAARVATVYQAVCHRLLQSEQGDSLARSHDDDVAELLEALEAFRSHFAEIKNDSHNIQAYHKEWQTILGCYEQLEAIIVAGLHKPSRIPDEANSLISNIDEVRQNTLNMMNSITESWQTSTPGPALEVIAICYDEEHLRNESHLKIASTVSRGNMLREIQVLLKDLDRAIRSLRFDEESFSSDITPTVSPRFIWLDLDAVRTAIRGFVIFWVATFIWIEFNPPGGFMFVTLCTALIPLVSYTPVTPKLLIFLFSFGFFFAIPAYVFLLPSLTHWLELATFLFGYAFLGFYLFAGPVAIFFLLGLFTLGIQNTMSYNFNVIVLIVLMFYLVCALQIVSVHFPFTSSPPKLYDACRRRFFYSCAKIMRTGHTQSHLKRAVTSMRIAATGALLGKMKMWGAMIDCKESPTASDDHILAFNRNCETLLGYLKILYKRSDSYARNPLISQTQHNSSTMSAPSLCESLAKEYSVNTINGIFASIRDELGDIDEQLCELLENSPEADGDDPNSRFAENTEVSDFYVYIGLQSAILSSIDHAREALVDINWQQLRETRF